MNGKLVDDGGAERKPLLIAMMGLPRSGKSTVVAKLSKELSAPIVRRDAIRLALHGERFLSKAEPMVKSISLYMIRALFLSGHEVVICDETNYSMAARDSLQDPMWDVKFYELFTPASTCMERAILTGQNDLIPIIESMASRYQPLMTPYEARYIPEVPCYGKVPCEIEDHYKAGERIIYVAPEVFDAYENGLTTMIRLNPSYLCYKDAKIFNASLR